MRNLQVVKKFENSLNCITVSPKRVTIEINGKDKNTDWNFLAQFLDRNIGTFPSTVRCQFREFSDCLFFKAKNKTIVFKVEKYNETNAFSIEKLSK
ncbi:MAG TPA: hypothetical protein PLP33_25215 [Leptospiraceae bacterium]|nr:hypothetical protein [Leptospiraceae bacterium]